MSSIVCQGLQSCFEPRFVEPPRTLGLKLTPPKSLVPTPTLEWVPSSSSSDSKTEVIQNMCMIDNNGDNSSTNVDDDDNGGWDFIQALDTTSKSFLKREDKETPYVHPLTKRNSSKLSEKSLELCTENLGCETGSDIGDSSDVYSNSSSSDSEGGKISTRDRLKFSRQNWSVNKKKFHSFPPPLTSISGSNSVQVRPHRENGRLVMKTVVVPSTQSCFQAERRDGRLRLHFVNNYHSSSSSTDHESSEETQVDEQQEEEIYNNTSNQEQVEESEEQVEQVEEESDVETEPEAEYYNKSNYQNHEDTDGNSYNGGVDMGREKFQRPSRCKESGRGKNGLLIWEPFWVAT